jgi:hypothetical protein
MGYDVSENGGQYDRGVAAGEIAQRLKQHDEHFAAINGSIDRVGDRLDMVVLQLQRLADAAEADRTTVVTTAAALKDAEAARRDTSETRWSPLTRLGVVVGILAGVAGLVAIVLASLRH